MAQKHVPDGEIRQNTRSTIKWGGDRQSTWIIIQNNNSKNDPRSQKKAHIKIIRKFNKDIEDAMNKQTEMNDIIMEMKDTPKGISSSIHDRTMSWKTGWCKSLLWKGLNKNERKEMRTV